MFLYTETRKVCSAACPKCSESCPWSQSWQCWQLNRGNLGSVEAPVMQWPNTICGCWMMLDDVGPMAMNTLPLPPWVHINCQLDRFGCSPSTCVGGGTKKCITSLEFGMFQSAVAVHTGAQFVYDCLYKPIELFRPCHFDTSSGWLPLPSRTTATAAETLGINRKFPRFTPCLQWFRYLQMFSVRQFTEVTQF